MNITNSLKKYILVSGIGFLPLGCVVIICDSMIHAETEKSLEARQSQTAFWLGLPYFILGFFMIYLSRDRKKFHIKSCRIVSILCFVLSLVALVFEGSDWNYYLNYNNYVCKTGSESTCNKTARLSSIFGSITLSTIVATLLCISNILICNWLLFRMSVERPEKDFDGLEVKKRSVSTQAKEDTDHFFRTQGYHACWNDMKEIKEKNTPRKEEREREENADTLQL